MPFKYALQVKIGLLIANQMNVCIFAKVIAMLGFSLKTPAILGGQSLQFITGYRIIRINLYHLMLAHGS
jgi:hypothetical protein